eukprot:749333-Hanusia_phi.AAC.2
MHCCMLHTRQNGKDQEGISPEIPGGIPKHDCFVKSESRGMETSCRKTPVCRRSFAAPTCPSVDQKHDMDQGDVRNLEESRTDDSD